MELLEEYNFRKAKINPVTDLILEFSVFRWLCWDYFELLIPSVSQKKSCDRKMQKQIFVMSEARLY